MAPRLIKGGAFVSDFWVVVVGECFLGGGFFVLCERKKKKNKKKKKKKKKKRQCFMDW